MTSKKKNKSKHKKKKGNFDNADDSLRILLQDEALVYCKMENYEKAIRQYTAITRKKGQVSFVVHISFGDGHFHSKHLRLMEILFPIRSATEVLLRDSQTKLTLIDPMKIAEIYISFCD